MDMAYQWQDVNISMERIDEIHAMDDEETAQRHVTAVADISIHLEHVSFKYDRMKSTNILDDITLDIPQGRVTAIVGASGSGKTTLAKLILGHYAPLQGHIDVGGTPLGSISLAWRRQCGVVMQDGRLFEESIAQNIALGYDEIDPDRIEYAAHMANILDYIDQLPMGFDTILYQGGQNLSNGQRQRLLIAHRLSTVRHADNIVVLHQGRIAEQGTHQELVQRRGMYYELVKNQLDIEE